MSVDIPVVVIALVGVLAFIKPAPPLEQRPKLVWTELLNISIAIACVQLMLDRGEMVTKLYDFMPAANAQRVRVSLAEKALVILTEQLNVRENNQFAEPFSSINPFHCALFLELDDGTVISESTSICRYLEELHPEPALFGRTVEERAIIDM